MEEIKSLAHTFLSSEHDQRMSSYEFNDIMRFRQLSCT